MDATANALEPQTIRSDGHYTLLTSDDLAQMPRPEWLVEDVMPSKGLACIYGPSGVGKSFLGLDLAGCLAAELPWFGFSTRQGDVIYVALEAQHGFRLRVEAWQKHREIEFPKTVYFVFDAFSLVSKEDPGALSQLINEWCDPKLVIIDTLNRAAPGRDENSPVDMGKIIAAASSIQTATGSTVLLIHHTGKDSGRGPRGHSSLYAAMDTVIEVAEDGERIIWTLAKSKDSEDGITKAFDLQAVELEPDASGKVWKSCVVVEAEDYSGPLTQKQPKGSNQRIVLDAVKTLLFEDQMLAAATGAPWPTSVPIDDLPNRLKAYFPTISPKHRLQRAKEALERLIEMGFLIFDNGAVSLLNNS